jgi:HlyD family secretion protein
MKHTACPTRSRPSRMHLSSTPSRPEIFLVALALAAGACADKAPTDIVRVSGQVEATDVHVSAPVAGRVLEMHLSEGQRVTAGALVARLETLDAELALGRARADRGQAEAQLRLLQAGARLEDIRQAEAQTASAVADASAATADLAGAEADVQRFESLLASSSGSRKQRDDAVTRRNMARERERAAEQRVLAAQEGVKRLRSGARREEIAAALARVAAAASQVAIWEKAIADATVTAPVAGIVTETIASVGELVPPRAPLVVITDLDHAWANVYVDEPAVPRLRTGQPATLFTDAGGSGVSGVVSYISKKAEFTPRNVQTAEDRSKLVYRVKISVDNKDGVLKSGMPVEAEMRFAQ